MLKVPFLPSLLRDVDWEPAVPFVWVGGGLDYVSGSMIARLSSEPVRVWESRSRSRSPWDFDSNASTSAASSKRRDPAGGAGSRVPEGIPGGFRRRWGTSGGG